MDPVTADQVKAAIQAKGIKSIHLRECSMCQYPLTYLIDGDTVTFDSGCDCMRAGHAAAPQPRTWEDVAQLINMQQVPAFRNKFLLACGLEVPA